MIPKKNKFQKLWGASSPQNQDNCVMTGNYCKGKGPHHEGDDPFNNVHAYGPGIMGYILKNKEDFQNSNIRLTLCKALRPCPPQKSGKADAATSSTGSMPVGFRWPCSSKPSSSMTALLPSFTPAWESSALSDSSEARVRLIDICVLSWHKEIWATIDQSRRIRNHSLPNLNLGSVLLSCSKEVR